MAGLTEGMLKAQVSEDAFFSGGRTYADRHRQAGNDLQAVLEVIRPASAGADIELGRPFRSVWLNYRLKLAVGGLNNEINSRVRNEDHTLTEVVAKAGGAAVVGNPGLPARTYLRHSNE
jgi:hypothetical protein